MGPGAPLPPASKLKDRLQGSRIAPRFPIPIEATAQRFAKLAERFEAARKARNISQW
jgi:hypothetical protein